jgi:very-short-patch-repair endonuclease
VAGVQTRFVLRRSRQRHETFSRRPSSDIADDMRGQRPTEASSRRVRDVAVDRAAAELATRQGGVVGREQLLALAVSPHAIDHRVRTGRFIAVFRGVYAVGHAAIGDIGRMHAALIAAGPGATLSHRTAGAVQHLIPSLPPFVEVTVTTAPRRSRPGLVIHATRRPPPIVAVDGLPVTTLLRTLVDLAPSLDPGELERACAEALVRGLVTADELQAARIIDPDRAAPTRSRLERRFLALVREAGLPRPLVNSTIGPYEMDFAWSDERVLVEVDGWTTHGHRFAFETDRARDVDLVAQGWVVLRFTWRQVFDQPFLVATRVAQALALRAAAA